MGWYPHCCCITDPPTNDGPCGDGYYDRFTDGFSGGTLNPAYSVVLSTGSPTITLGGQLNVAWTSQASGTYTISRPCSQPTGTANFIYTEFESTEFWNTATSQVSQQQIRIKFGTSGERILTRSVNAVSGVEAYSTNTGGVIGSVTPANGDIMRIEASHSLTVTTVWSITYKINGTTVQTSTITFKNPSLENICGVEFIIHHNFTSKNPPGTTDALFKVDNHRSGIEVV